MLAPAGLIWFAENEPAWDGDDVNAPTPLPNNPALEGVEGFVPDGELGVLEASLAWLWPPSPASWCRSREPMPFAC